MTKAELAKKMTEFIASERDDYEDEWYMSPRELAESVLAKFAQFAKIPLATEN